MCSSQITVQQQHAKKLKTFNFSIQRKSQYWIALAACFWALRFSAAMQASTCRLTTCYVNSRVYIENVYMDGTQALAEICIIEMGLKEHGTRRSRNVTRAKAGRLCTHNILRIQAADWMVAKYVSKERESVFFLIVDFICTATTNMGKGNKKSRWHREEIIHIKEKKRESSWFFGKRDVQIGNASNKTGWLHKCYWNWKEVKRQWSDMCISLSWIIVIYDFFSYFFYCWRKPVHGKMWKISAYIRQYKYVHKKKVVFHVYYIRDR